MTSPTPPPRDWLPAAARTREQRIYDGLRDVDAGTVGRRIDDLIARNRVIHELECINLNPATNVMNPRAEAALAAGLGTRPSLGHPGDKYEMGLEAIEEIEVITAALARRVFGARYVEIRVTSGAMANLTAFMATCRPGDAIIAPPAEIAGHVTHHAEGAAGLYGLRVHHAPVDPESFTVDIPRLAALAEQVRPKLITIGGSLNLFPHPVAAVRDIADGVGAAVLFDAAHVCGLLAGGAWPNPLDAGADLLTMSTYKSLAGPPGGLVLTNRSDLAERVEGITYPGLTANFDAGTTAALAITLLDWVVAGADYAAAMVAAAGTLAAAMADEGLPVVTTGHGHTASHQFVLDASGWGGGHAAATRLRAANILSSGIGIPRRDGMAGLRLGTPEVVRWGMTTADMPALARLVADGLREDPAEVAPRTSAFRRRFADLCFVAPYGSSAV